MGCHFLLQGVFLTQDPTQVSCVTGGFFTIEPPGKPHLHLDKFMNIPVDKIHYQPETAPRYGRCFADHTRNYVLVRTLLVMYNRIWTQSKEDFLTHITELVLRIERSAAKIRVIATWTRSLTRPRFLPHRLTHVPCAEGQATWLLTAMVHRLQQKEAIFLSKFILEGLLFGSACSMLSAS